MDEEGDCIFGVEYIKSLTGIRRVRRVMGGVRRVRRTVDEELVGG